MDTITRKTPEPLPFEAWRTLSPSEAARLVETRIDSLSPAFRSAALAWKPARESQIEAPDTPTASAPLRGLPYLLKDLFDVHGAPTRAGSSFLAEVRPVQTDATIVQRLRSLGATLAGKTHLVEFAAGLTGENRTYGDCPHPHLPDRLAGGSSSGSAALVGAGVVPFAIGTDTGGSVRVPAAFCGLYGYRHVPGDPLIRDAFPLSPTCDTAGWFTAHREDMRELLRALLGDPTPSPRIPRGACLKVADLLPGIWSIAESYENAARTLAAPADAGMREFLREAWSDSLDAYVTIVMHEAHATHAPWLQSHRERYDPVIWQRLHEAGSFASARVTAARATAARVRQSFETLFATLDFLVLPCAPMPALRKEECTPEARRAILTCTTPASLAGLPCLTLPVSLPDGSTAGLQVIAREPNSFVFHHLLRA